MCVGYRWIGNGLGSLWRMTWPVRAANRLCLPSKSDPSVLHTHNRIVDVHIAVESTDEVETPSIDPLLTALLGLLWYDVRAQPRYEPFCLLHC